MLRSIPIKLNGIAGDLPPEEVGDRWSAGSNFYQKDQGMRRVDGYDLYADTNWPAGQQPIFILPVELPLLTYWLYVSEGAGNAISIYVTDGTNHYDITPTVAPTGAQIGLWTGTVLNGVPVLNNQIDPPWWWDGNTGNVMTILPDWPAGQLCRAIRSYRYYLVALGITRSSVVYPDLLAWSDAASPGTIPASWTPLPSTDAGENTLADTQGGIIDAGKVRDTLAIYKNYSTTLMQYVGGTFVFAFRDSPSVSVGSQSQNCVAESEGYAYLFTGDDVVRHDGQQSASICTDEVRKQIVLLIDPARYQQAMVTARHLTDEIWVCVPELDQEYLTLAYIYNTRTGRWGKRTLPGVTHLDFGLVGDEDALITWDQQVDTWAAIERRWDKAFYSETANEILMSDYNGQRLLVVDRIANNAGVDITAWLSREGLPAGDMDRIKYMNELWPQIFGEEGQEVTIKIGGQLNYNDPVNWSPALPFKIGQQPAKVDCAVVGRWFSFQIEGTGGKAWWVYDMEVRVKEKGRF